MPQAPLDSLPGIVPGPWDRLSLGPFLARSLLAGVTHLETLTLLSPASERPTRSLALQGPRLSCLPSTAELSHSLPLNSTQLFPCLTRVLPHDTLTTLTVQLQYLEKGKTTKAALNPPPVSLEARPAGVPGRHSQEGEINESRLPFPDGNPQDSTSNCGKRSDSRGGALA